MRPGTASVEDPRQSGRIIAPLAFARQPARLDPGPVGGTGPPHPTMGTGPPPPTPSPASERGGDGSGAANDVVGQVRQVVVEAGVQPGLTGLTVDLEEVLERV